MPILNAFKVNIAFSNDGKYFALFRRKVNILQIYEIDNNDIEGLMDKVAEGKYLKQYANLFIFQNAQKMLFDLNSRFLACYGREVINIIHLKSEERKIDTKGIDQKLFKEILDVQLSSSEDGVYRCDVACLANQREEVS